jgi:aminomethyltransferase
MRTHLYEFHKRNAKLTEFAGFEMPLWYDGIISEHLAVRESVGIFDVTHMGRYLITGRDAAKFLDKILTQNVASMKIYQGKISMICNELGGIVDDVFLFRLEEDKYLLICNAANRKKDYEWMIKHACNFSVNIMDISDNTAMFAVQGPKSLNVLHSIFNSNLSDLRFNYFKWVNLDDLKVFVSRTGYTGEDGFELLLWDTPLSNPEKAYKVWEMILESGKEYNIKPCGLGARDTLRIEAGFCLYGNDINETITPLEAKLDFAIKFEKPDFIGREALLKQKTEGVKRVRVGVRSLEYGVLRSGYKILFNGKPVGEVTSGTFSPLLKCGIGMGYVPPEISSPKTSIDILIRGKAVRAEIAEMPFYKTTKYKKNGRRSDLQI